MVIKLKFFCLISILTLGEFVIADALNIQPLGSNTYVVTDQVFFDSNVLVAKMPDETVLVASSPFETVDTTLMIKWIKNNLHPKKMVAINTHFHADGTGGNEAYQNAGFEIWASKQTRKLQKGRGEAGKTLTASSFKDPKLRKRIFDTKVVLASKTFEPRDGLKLNFGGEEVEVIYPGPAHTPDNVVVYLPKRKLLFGGCMIRAAGSKNLGYTGDADIAHWAESAGRLEKLAVEKVIPGHGAVGGPELIKQTINLAEIANQKPE